MKMQSIANNINRELATEPLRINRITDTAGNMTDDYRNLFQKMVFPGLDDLLEKLINASGKKSFLVFKNNKYINVLTENIAFFYIKYESPMIACFDRQEFFVNYSLEQVQNLLPPKQFFR